MINNNYKETKKKGKSSLIENKNIFYTNMEKKEKLCIFVKDSQCIEQIWHNNE